MAELSDVKRWFISRGIGHIVASCSSNGIFTLCPSWIVGWWDFRKLPTEIPKRICRKCRDNLKKAKVVGGKDAG